MHVSFLLFIKCLCKYTNRSMGNQLILRKCYKKHIFDQIKG